MPDTTDEMVYENNKLEMKIKMYTRMAVIGVIGLLGVTFMFFERPVARSPDVVLPAFPSIPEPLMSADDCTKMCGDKGVESFDRTHCACKTLPAPVVSKMKCDCQEDTRR